MTDTGFRHWNGSLSEDKGEAPMAIHAANHGAVNLYLKCGFSETHRIHREKNHYGIMRDRIYMEKRLR